MTDFVIDKLENLIPSEIGNEISKIHAYARFLKQPLQLSMFVPVDEDGNVLEEPRKSHVKYQLDFSEEDYFDSMGYEIDLRKYQKAKERCLFEGFEIKNSKIYNEEDIKFLGMKDYGQNKFAEINPFRINDRRYNFETIEDLVRYNLTLTPNAIKKIGM